MAALPDRWPRDLRGLVESAELVAMFAEPSGRLRTCGGCGAQVFERSQSSGPCPACEQRRVMA